MVLDPRVSGGLVLMPEMLLTLLLQSRDEDPGSWASIPGTGLTEEDLRTGTPPVRFHFADLEPEGSFTPPPLPPTPGAPGSPSSEGPRWSS
jgi:hypothetical protein